MAKFSCGDTVLNIVTQQKGVVCEVCPPARGRQLYRVRYNESLETCLEQNLDGFFEIENPFERVRKGIFGNRDQFVLVNTTYKINNSNNNTISSLKASKTLFKAYQFKPLLKFLNSHTRRILIADEVGLGKTIEAGHILLELKAREEFKTALIVCPNSLKIKWQTELQEKFGLSFKIYESLNDAVEDLKAHPQNARGILNYEKIRAKRKDDSKSNDDTGPTNALIEFLQSGQRKYSVVLCDEAHKMRNNETQTYRGMTRILDYADSVVFLTATPIMLGENDLYNLLHLLEPYDFDNQEVFRNLISANRPFVKAISMLNANEPLPAIKELLTISEIKETHEIGELIYSTDSTVKELYSGIPLYEKILEMLDKEDSLALRAQLQSDISAMSSINNVFSRTRKREVSTDERQQTERKAHKINICLSEREREIYDEVIDNYLESKGGVEYDIYGEEIMPKGAILGLIQKKRMVASSVNGYRLFTDNDCDVEAFCNDVSSQNNLPDSKIDNLVEIFNGVKAAGASKVIVFSIFKFTVRYLAIRLQKMGYKVFAIHGDIKEREKIIQEFKACRDFCVLLSTEVGSEGLDMQFCSHLVNYDLPWNPMKIEQRCGRVDRIGQQRDVHIYNFIVGETVENRVREVLEEKLSVILKEMGVDKYSDVLDSEVAECDFTDVYMRSIGHASQVEKNLYPVEAEMKQQLTNAQKYKDVIREEKDLTKLVGTESNFDVDSALRTMLTYYECWQGHDPRLIDRISIADEEITQHLKTELVQDRTAPLMSIQIDNFPNEEGYFMLWELSISEKESGKRILPIFVNSAMILRPMAGKRIMDVFLDGNSKLRVSSAPNVNVEIYSKLEKSCMDFAYDTFVELKEKQMQQNEESFKKYMYALELRQEAAEHIGIENIRRSRLQKLQKEKANIEAQHRKGSQVYPDFRLIMMARLEA